MKNEELQALKDAIITIQIHNKGKKIRDTFSSMVGVEVLKKYVDRRKINKNDDFNSIWKELGYISVYDDDITRQDFYQFKAGTPKEDIWHELEEIFNITLGDLIN